jgi:hypothetical protein
MKKKVDMHFNKDSIKALEKNLLQMELILLKV